MVADTVLTRLPEAASVLDVGCGTGLVGRELRARGYGGRLHGLDLSQASLDIARESGGYDALERADLQQPLPLEDDAVDAVVCVGVMTYLPDVEPRCGVSSPGWPGPAASSSPPSARTCGTTASARPFSIGSQDDGVLRSSEVTGPAPYLPQGYGGTPEVACFYLTATVA